MKSTSIVAYENARVRCVLDLELRGRAFLHLRIKQWDATTRRLIADRLQVLLSVLPELGVSKLESFMPVSDARIAKMARLFGFVEVRRNAEYILMEHKYA